jgi:hypothetical protein
MIGFALREFKSERFCSDAEGDLRWYKPHPSACEIDDATVGSFDMIGINWDLRRGVAHLARFKEGKNDARRTSVTQNTNTLSMQVDIMPPARRMEHFAFERFDSL